MPPELPAPPPLRTLELHAPPAAAPRSLLAAEADRPPAWPGWCNRLVLGDNLAVMAALLPELRGAVDLVYLDPPFGTGGRFRVRRAPGAEPAAAYADLWPGGLRGYLEMLQPRLWLVRELLSPAGSLYVQLDATAVHYVKVLLDELFGPECFQREIVWRIGWVSGYKGTVRNWVRNHDTILFYTRDPQRFTFHKEYVPHPPGYRRRGGGEGPGHPVDDVWNGSPAEHALTGADSLDSIQIKSFSPEKTGYETQKNESLLARIIRASSSPGQLVADFFAGSGTTLAVAERLGRRWLGCDVATAAVHIARKRLLGLPGGAPFAVLACGAAAAAGVRPSGRGGGRRQANAGTDAAAGGDVDERAASGGDAPGGDDADERAGATAAATGAAGVDAGGVARAATVDTGARPCAMAQDDGATVVREDAEVVVGGGEVAPGQPTGLPAAAGSLAPVAAELTGRRVVLRLLQPEAVDYLAVQWEAEGPPLRPDLALWRTYALRGDRPLPASVSHTYPTPGERVLAVHVADAQGRLRAYRWRLRPS